MRIITYGLDESVVRTVAGRCGVQVCRNFDEPEREHSILPLPQPESPEERLDCSARMAEREERIDAVIAAANGAFSEVHYCTQPGKFFTIRTTDDEADTEYELTRIVETLLGRIRPHEGVGEE